MEKKEVIAGRNPVFEYLKSMENSRKGVELFISSKAHGKIIGEIKKLAGSKGVKISLCDMDFLKKYSASSQGVAIFAPLSRKTLDLDGDLDKISAEKGLVVVLDQITDPHNLGSIIRTAEALGCSTIVVPKNNSADVNEVVRKTSAGATAYVDIHRIGNLSRFIDEVKEKGFWVVGTSDHGTADITKLNEIRPACIIIGSEGKGMRRLTEDKCDYVVTIPLTGKVSSLNASVAAGIVLYEAAKS